MFHKSSLILYFLSYFVSAFNLPPWMVHSVRYTGVKLEPSSLIDAAN